MAVIIEETERKMRMRRDEGFAMVQVLILIMIILMFLTSLFSYAGFRHRAALMRIQTEEAKYAAKAAVNLMEIEIENGNTEWLIHGLEKTETLLEFKSEDGNTEVEIPVSIWIELEENEVYLFAEAGVGAQKEVVHAVMEFPEKQILVTNSNAGLATSSTAYQSERKE